MPPLYSADNASDVPYPSHDLPTVQPQILSPDRTLERCPSSNTLSTLTVDTSYETEHIYSLSNKKGSPLVTLRVKSMAQSPHEIPVFTEGLDIHGSVDFDLPANGNVQSATLILEGSILHAFGGIGAASPMQSAALIKLGGNLSKMSSNDNERLTFLNQRQVMTWGNSASAKNRIFKSKKERLPSGKFTCPFEFSLPDMLYLPHDPLRPHKLPPSFAEPFTKDKVEYKLILAMKNAKFMPQTEVGVIIRFIPLNRPTPASILRQVSYRDNTPLLGPALDPKGWHCLPTTKVFGRISDNRHVVVDCTLSLAKPLCYTRGSVLPCHIAMHSRNAQALDILTVPKACKIRLHRIAGIFSRTSQQENKQIVDKFPRTSVFVASAMMWLARDNDDSHTRYLEGEIPLPNDLTPSTILDDFEVSYAVVLLPFEVPGFTSRDDDPLSEVSVEIVTAYAPGPRPRSYAASAGLFYANHVGTEQFEAAPVKLLQRWGVRRS